MQRRARNFWQPRALAKSFWRRTAGQLLDLEGEAAVCVRGERGRALQGCVSMRGSGGLWKWKNGLKSHGGSRRGFVLTHEWMIRRVTTRYMYRGTSPIINRDSEIGWVFLKTIRNFPNNGWGFFKIQGKCRLQNASFLSEPFHMGKVPLKGHPPAGAHCRGTSLTRNSAPLGPCSRNMPRVLRFSWGGGLFLMSEVPR